MNTLSLDHPSLDQDYTGLISLLDRLYYAKPQSWLMHKELWKLIHELNNVEEDLYINLVKSQGIYDSLVHEDPARLMEFITLDNYQQLHKYRDFWVKNVGQLLAKMSRLITRMEMAPRSYLFKAVYFRPIARLRRMNTKSLTIVNSQVAQIDQIFHKIDAYTSSLETKNGFVSLSGQELWDKRSKVYSFLA